VTERKTGTKKREKIGRPNSSKAGFPKAESMISGLNLATIVIGKDETGKHEEESYGQIATQDKGSG